MEKTKITEQPLPSSESQSESQMASSLRLTEARLIGILTSAMDAIITVDAQQQIVFFNTAAEKMFRCSAADVLGKPLERLIPLRLRDTHRNYISQFGETGISQRTMGKLRPISGMRADGEEFPIEASISQVDAEGHKLYTAIIRDISDKKKLEAQFLRVQRMESIGTLAGGIAHDLNNVLSPILTAVELLQMRFTDESSQRLLNILQTNTMRGSEMIKQVLSFARGVEGQYAPLQPRHLIKEITKTLKDTLPKNIAISFTSQSDLWSVTGDATQLHQVLMNLCVNARDAMPQGGQLHLEAENLVIDDHYAAMNSESKPGKHVCISVSDTGIGIPQSAVSKIFDPFFTTKEHGQGTGLGLSTVAGIVRSHGGFVTVYSEEGRGSQFKVYLPALGVTDVASPDGQVLRANLPVGNGELIMMVDDEEAIRQIAKETLLTFGYQVLVAADGTEALALFAQHQNEVRCVVTDMMMPFMDGLATIRAIRRLSSEVKIVVTSGLKANDKIAEAAQLGAKTFLPKPYTAEALLKVLATELRGG